MKRAFVAMTFVLAACARWAEGETPKSISVQGYLESATGGLPINGPVDFCVALFDADSGGCQVWPVPPVECQSAPCHILTPVTVESGLFALTFGDLDLTPQLWGTAAGPRSLWLEIKAGNQVMSPRIALHTAPYAFRVGFVDNPELTNALEADSLKLGDTTPGTMGTLRAYNGQTPNQETLSLIAHSSGTGGPGGGDVVAWNGRTPNIQTAVLDGNGNAGGGEFRLATATGATTLLAFAQPDGASGGAELQLRNSTTDRVGVLARGRGPFGGTLGLFREDGGNAPFGAIGINLQAGADSIIELRHNNDENNMILHAKDAATGGAKLIISNGQPVNRQTITIEGNSGDGDGRIAMRDDANNETLSLTTQGTYGRSSLEMKDTTGVSRVDLGVGSGTNIPHSYLRLNSPNPGSSGNRLRVNIEAGTSNLDYGSIECLNADARPGVSIYGGPSGGGSSIRLRNEQSPTPVDAIVLTANDAGNGEPLLGMKSTSNSNAVLLGIDSTSHAGFLNLRDSGNVFRINLNGADGSACFAGLLKAGSANLNSGCDLAESFELSNRGEIQPGMVLVMDAKRLGHLTLSMTSYDKKVAGIVSGAGGLNPGVKLGQRADGSDDLPIALSGRVYCFVDATQHAVEIGDLLTTSNTPGHAMKVTDFARSQGTSLGKAMEPLEKGKKGLVLVLVALQ